MKRQTCIAAAAVAIALCFMVGLADAVCRKAKTNRKGTAGADITVSSSSVVVADANTSRCALLIRNSSSNDMRCRAVPDGAPTTTVGVLIAASQSLGLEEEGQEEWQCIRTGASDATANVVEGLP